jgi:hypothetical protein
MQTWQFMVLGCAGARGERAEARPAILTLFAAPGYVDQVRPAKGGC